MPGFEQHDNAPEQVSASVDTPMTCQQAMDEVGKISDKVVNLANRLDDKIANLAKVVVDTDGDMHDSSKADYLGRNKRRFEDKVREIKAAMGEMIIGKKCPDVAQAQSYLDALNAFMNDLSKASSSDSAEGGRFVTKSEANKIMDSVNQALEGGGQVAEGENSTESDNAVVPEGKLSPEELSAQLKELMGETSFDSNGVETVISRLAEGSISRYANRAYGIVNSIENDTQREQARGLLLAQFPDLRENFDKFDALKVRSETAKKLEDLLGSFTVEFADSQGTLHRELLSSLLSVALKSDYFKSWELAMTGLEQLASADSSLYNQVQNLVSPYLPKVASKEEKGGFLRNFFKRDGNRGSNQVIASRE